RWPAPTLLQLPVDNDLLEKTRTIARREQANLAEAEKQRLASDLKRRQHHAEFSRYSPLTGARALLPQ
ncbi:MAG: hypothetical protein JZU63_09675, partial [Rhodoferax sp.]|nr:hypothetical protein [Rhodoferax sp.]